jgi:hypothetical protein
MAHRAITPFLVSARGIAPRPRLAAWAVAFASACTGQIDGISSTATAQPPGMVAASVDARPAFAPAGACAPRRIGPAPLRRLVRDEYLNAVKDLFPGVTFAADPTAGFPKDERVAGYVSGAAGSIDELHVEKFREAAAAVATAALERSDLLMACPASGTSDACVAFVERLAARAFRRPLLDDERPRLAALFAAGSGDGARNGLRLVIEALLQAPSFLYRIEVPTEARREERVPLGPHELATRLSFLLWRSIPDAALAEAAASGRLASPEGIAAEARRMLADARARASMVSFHHQWMRLDGIEGVDKDRRIYPAFDERLRGDMQLETARFADHVVREGDGRIGTLLGARFSFVSPALAALYGVGAPPSRGADGLGRVELPHAERAGLLTHASFLSVHAHPDQTSPVHRGKVVRESLLCESVPEPPADVNDTPPLLDERKPTRQRFEEHRSNPTCAACHAFLDPAGFIFEAHDGIGRFRTMEGRGRVDATGELQGVADDALRGTIDGVRDLALRLAKSGQVSACVARSWFRFAMGRPESPDDACTLGALERTLGDSGGDLRALLAALVQSESFRFRPALPD